MNLTTDQELVSYNPHHWKPCKGFRDKKLEAHGTQVFAVRVVLLVSVLNPKPACLPKLYPFLHLKLGRGGFTLRSFGAIFLCSG